ncbi:hypothetical protein BDN67DRAFT_968280 [Paxillus ammoniavirescens]|nr:hypothetical protein BDN67DRAFT_968280 [Paxillus ammoniavirescens]
MWGGTKEPNVSNGRARQADHICFFGLSYKTPFRLSYYDLPNRLISPFPARAGILD